jgi:hypothetical protein
MKIKCLNQIPNSGIFLESKWEVIEIKQGRFIQSNTSHPLVHKGEKFYKKVICLENKNKKVYWLNRFGQHSKHHGVHIGLNRFQNQRFLWLQNAHWLQQEANIKFIINIGFVLIGIYLGLK